MPYKDKKKQSEYQNQVSKNRRKEWLEKNGPCFICFNEENLEVHHVLSDKKVTHRIWSYCKENREAELETCVPLCDVCHRRLHAKQKRIPFHTIERVVRDLKEGVLLQREIGDKYGLSRRSIVRIKVGRR